MFFRLNDDAISEYFPLNKVIEGMFNLCNKLFGIHFRVSIYPHLYCVVSHENINYILIHYFTFSVGVSCKLIPIPMLPPGCWKVLCKTHLLYPRSPKGRGVYCFTSVRLSVLQSFRPSKIFFVAFFSVTIDGRNLIFGHKLHIGMSYCGWHFWTCQIPTSCLPT